jgi:hypothetical protein
MRVVAANALRVLSIVTLAAFAGCGGSPLKVHDGGGAGSAGSGSAGGGGTTCAGLDQATCTTTPGCSVIRCSDCPSGQAFAGCAPYVQPTACGSCPPDCSTLDEASCEARSDCRPEYCGSCDGGQTFVGCGALGAAAACPATVCDPPPSCAGFSETSCKATSGCRPEYCPSCAGGLAFVGCTAPGSPSISCGLPCPNMPSSCVGVDLPGCNARPWCTPYQCPDCMGGQLYAGCGAVGGAPIECGPCALPPCTDVTTQAQCDARTDCHSVFANFGCECTLPGCCATFISCGGGATANCSGPSDGSITCKMTVPTCPIGYVLSFTTDCYEGCVPPRPECLP